MFNNTFRFSLKIQTAILFLLVAVTFVNAQYEGAKPVPANWRKGFESIKIDEAKNLLEFIAGPDFLGRSPAQPGFAAVAGFTASYFRQQGLKPAGAENSYLQRFNVSEVRILPETAAFESADGSLRFEFGKDVIFRAPADFETTAQFVFLRIPKGADVSALDLNALKGKIVVMSSDSVANNRDLFIKIIAPQSAFGNPLAMVNPVKAGTPMNSAPIVRNKEVPILPTDNKFNGLRMVEAVADKIAEKCGAKNYLAAETNQATIETCDQDYKLRAKIASKDLFETMNVVAKIEGSDPVLKDEAVFIAAHLDHLGVRNNAIFYGADDDGSGTTAVMLIAKALMQNPVKPKRSIIIALWCGEEMGVLGSRHYVNFPTFPLDKVISYLNLDMVGRNEEDKRFNEKPENNTTSVYTGSVKFNSEDLYKLLYETNAYVNLRLKDDHEDRVLRTDTANFYNRNIPTLKTFTGEHLDYHKATDTPDKINYEKLTNIAKWIYLTAMELSTNPVKPRYERKPFVAAPNPTN
ncbi:MAG: M20/M25/M40 family metallo-hydrolase [Pyrinomonadaceae bacterium]|nr:M20/M25/M40 family metallo-hydrolase [Pyrinomonadaceae bacterium]